MPLSRSIVRRPSPSPSGTVPNRFINEKNSEFQRKNNNRYAISGSTEFSVTAQGTLRLAAAFQGVAARTFQVTAVASDGSTATASVTVMLMCAAPVQPYTPYRGPPDVTAPPMSANRPPVFDPASYTFSLSNCEDGATLGAVTASDPDGDTLT